MDLNARLMGLFLGELEERIDAFDRDLLALEAGSEDNRAELISGLFRGAHSLKGAASSVEAPEIEAVCHRLEDLLAAVRDGRNTLDGTKIQLLFEVADALRATGRALAEGQPPPSRLLGFVPQLRDAAKSGAPTSEPPPRAAAPEPLSAPAADVHGSANGRSEAAVRIAAHKLDDLLVESAELLVVHHRTGERLREVQGLGEMIRQVRADWVADAGRLRPEHRDRLRELDRTIERFSGAMVRDRYAFEQAARRVNGEVRRARMIPFTTACEGLERIVRDAARASHKEARIEISGREIELDRSILEGLRNVFVHLVRNAVDHGIEPAQNRMAIGKPATGTISISAASLGNSVEVVVTDDGAGLDLAALRERATEKGIALDDEELASIVFMPGISTKHTVTGLSGRGVGLDAVRAAIEALRGTIDVSSKPGKGTRFTVTLPLTLTTVRAVLFRVGRQDFALDTAVVERVARIDAGKVISIEGRPHVVGFADPMPLLSFGAILDVPCEERDDRAYIPAIIARAGERRVALAVDALLDESEVMIRGLGPRLEGMRSVAGVTIVADGSIVPIVATAFVFERAILVGRSGRVAATPAISPAVQKRILLVDDSVTTRALERSILEAEGYEVVTATDGQDAWETLLANQVDLVVSDIDMPRKDGFQLAEAIRGSNEFQNLPIVLVTARESDDDKKRGIQVGADAYIVKAAFEQGLLLDTIGQLL